MATNKAAYDAERARKKMNDDEKARQDAVAKGAMLAALNGVLAFFTGRAALNIMNFQHQVGEGKPPLTGISIRFQVDALPPKAE